MPLRRTRPGARRGSAAATAALLLVALLAACDRGPRPIAYGRDACDYCRMVISDPRYGGGGAGY